jgi:hypothetical protein
MRVFIIKEILGESISKIGLLNIMSFVFVVYMLILAIRKGVLNFKIAYLWIITNILIIISIALGGFKNTTLNNLIFWINDIFILIIIGIKSYKIIEIEKTVKAFIGILNCTIIIVVIIGIVDYLTGSKIQEILAEYYFNEGYFTRTIIYQADKIYRYYSVLGHPLRLSGIILINYALNIVYRKYYESIININFLSAISLIGICLANSKAGIVSIVGLIILSNFSEKKGLILKIVFTGTLLVVLFSTSLFRSTILNRFFSTDLTTGRSEIVSYIKTGYIPQPSLIGKGPGYSYYVSNEAATGALSFEYPPIMYSYDCGIIGMLFIYSILFIYPIYILIRSKQWFVVFCYLIVFLQYNTHAGIVVQEDTMGQLVFFTYIIINIVGVNEKKNSKQKFKS